MAGRNSGLFLLDPEVFHIHDWIRPEWAAQTPDPITDNNAVGNRIEKCQRKLPLVNGTELSVDRVSLIEIYSRFCVLMKLEEPGAFISDGRITRGHTKTIAENMEYRVEISRPIPAV